jgi:hypothetical protein
MSRQSNTAVGGLEEILDELGDRFEYDTNGRITGVQGGGVSPRFVLGRATEGCVWRFSANLEPDRVVAVARLAARELGFPIAGERPVLPPERLVMIERLLATGGVGTESRRETLMREGVEVGELWTID